MNTRVDTKVVVVIPNWNGVAELGTAIDSVLAQSVPLHLIVVDNGSTDGSLALLDASYPQIEVIKHSTNRGYTGGVNPGYQRAMELGATYTAPFNNDAVADPHWLEHMVRFLDEHASYGIASCKVASADGTHLDSTGDYYSTWGLPYPRGRGEVDSGQYDAPSARDIFAGSGAASLYRVSMLRQIGLLDEDFFAYYEDVDISFRAQLAGWKIAYVPESVVWHETSTTGSKIKGFFTYQTMKNLPMLLTRTVPRSLLPTILPRFTLVYLSFFVAAVQRGHLRYALRGYGRFLVLLPRKLRQRRTIQRSRQVSDDYIRSMLLWDLPPNADRLRRLRSAWRRFVKKQSETEQQ